MKDRIRPASAPQQALDTPRFVHSRSRDLLLSRLQKLTWGKITLQETGRSQSYGQQPTRDAPQVNVTVEDPRFYTSLMLGGSIGVAEAYMRRYWSCDDLPALIRILIRNASVLQRLDSGLARMVRPGRRLFHWLRRNTRRGSQWNIYAHYDLGNDFYALFLDETMTYSAGIFRTPESTLAEASIEKYDTICRKLDLTPDDHVVEVGCGWGGFALHAARTYGCRVTGTTISRQQYDWATKKVEESGLSDRVRILLQDYRDLKGTFDKLVSIEMIEAVGHQYLAHFLKNCSDLLRPDGLMALQAITIVDQRYARHTRNVDFIKRYIFPGSCLVSTTALCERATRHTDLRAIHLEDISSHYAETLRRWRSAFFEKIDRVRALGFDEPFIRMWDFYLSYCEGAFDEHYIGDIQMVFAKPLYRRPSLKSTGRSVASGDKKEGDS